MAMAVTKTAGVLAKAQLAGGYQVGEPFFGSRHTLFACRMCASEFHLDSESDPCAFCNGCKDTVLDMLAKEVLRLRKARR